MCSQTCMCTLANSQLDLGPNVCIWTTSIRLVQISHTLEYKWPIINISQLMWEKNLHCANHWAKAIHQVICSMRNVTVAQHALTFQCWKRMLGTQACMHAQACAHTQKSLCVSRSWQPSTAWKHTFRQTDKCYVLGPLGLKWAETRAILHWA